MSTPINNPALNSLQRILVYDIRIDGEAVNLTSSEIKQVDIVNSENSHEYAKITTQLTKKDIDRFVDKPISFSYGRKSSSSVFYGYVVSISPNRNYQQDTIVDIECLGPTWVLQNGSPKFFTSITAPAAFTNIVHTYNLGVQVDPHPYVWPALSQTSESDWEFLQVLANKIGYAIYNYRGVVRLLKPLKILNETPVYRGYIKGDDVLDNTRELLDWEASTKSLSLRENIKPSFGFFNGTTPATTKSLITSNSAIKAGVISPYRAATDVPVANREMAETYSKAWEDRLDFWNNEATARINGNAQLVPGVNVSIEVGTNAYVKNEYDGVWLVRGVRHSLTHNSFQTLMTLCRDSTQSPVNVNNKWFWNSDKGMPSLKYDSMKKRWVSSWAENPPAGFVSS